MSIQQLMPSLFLSKKSALFYWQFSKFLISLLDLASISIKLLEKETLFVLKLYPAFIAPFWMLDCPVIQAGISDIWFRDFYQVVAPLIQLTCLRCNFRFHKFNLWLAGLSGSPNNDGLVLQCDFRTYHCWEGAQVTPVGTSCRGFLFLDLTWMFHTIQEEDKQNVARNIDRIYDP